MSSQNNFRTILFDLCMFGKPCIPVFSARPNNTLWKLLSSLAVIFCLCCNILCVSDDSLNIPTFSLGVTCVKRWCYKVGINKTNCFTVLAKIVIALLYLFKCIIGRWHANETNQYFWFVTTNNSKKEIDRLGHFSCVREPIPRKREILFCLKFHWVCELKMNVNVV